MYAQLEEECDNSSSCLFFADLKEPLPKASASCVAFLEELSLLPEITEDSITLCIDKIATAVKHSFPGEYTLGKNNIITFLFKRAFASFLMKQIESLPIPSCSEAAQN